MIHRSEQRTVHPVQALGGIFFHGIMLFLLPFMVGGIASAFLEVSEVAETLGALGSISFVIIAPIFVVQFIGVVTKTMQEARFLKQRGELSLRTLLDAAYRNTRLLTSRGYFMFFSGVVFVLLALAFKWASLGVIAVSSLLLFYLVTGASVFLSAFLVRTFEAGLGRDKAGIRREFHPSVGRCGAPIEEKFLLTKVPVLPGYFLAIEDRLPERLDTDVRHVIPPKAGRETAEVLSVVRRTPRGTYEVGPARIWYQDMLGLTKINVASLATARLKLLPRMSSVEIIEPPRTPLEEPDILTRPHKFPTEDFFRFREYAPGDDTRRLHWKLSMRVGQLQVRLPETREISARKVVLALDTWVPEAWLSRTEIIDDLMDALVDVWVSTADQLIKAGEHVTLVAALRGEDGVLRREAIDCAKGQRPKWLDAGARAAWQSETEVFGLFEEDDTPEEAFMVVLTSRLEPVPPDPLPGRRTTWVYLHPGDTIGPPEPSPFDLWLNWKDEPEFGQLKQVLRFFQLPHPAGSDENSLWSRVNHFRARLSRRNKRAWIRQQVLSAGERAFGAILSRPDVVYRMQVHPDRYVLVGISSGTGGEQRDVPDVPAQAPPDQSSAYPGARPGVGSPKQAFDYPTQ